MFLNSIKIKISRLINTLKKRAAALKTEIRALYFAYRDPDMPLLPKLLIFLTLGYALSPIDLIPDFIPVLGYLDDLIILPALIALSIKTIPKGVLERARIRAEKEPVRMKKNWFVAAIIILLWIMMAAVIVVLIDHC